MRLNLDCIRDILLTADEELTLHKNMEFYHGIKYESLKDYSFDELHFHALQCSMSGLIIIKRYVDGGFSIRDITPEGYAFLDKVRSNKMWNTVKTSLKKLGVFSLKSIIDAVLTTLIP